MTLGDKIKSTAKDATGKAEEVVGDATGRPGTKAEDQERQAETDRQAARQEEYRRRREEKYGPSA